MIFIILVLAGAAAESIYLTFEFINAHKVQQKYLQTEDILKCKQKSWQSRNKNTVAT